MRFNFQKYKSKFKKFTYFPKIDHTCSQALKHEWISGSGAKQEDISVSVQAQLREQMIRKKWKKVFRATSVINQMKRLQITKSVAD